MCAWLERQGPVGHAGSAQQRLRTVGEGSAAKGVLGTAKGVAAVAAAASQGRALLPGAVARAMLAASMALRSPAALTTGCCCVPGAVVGWAGTACPGALRGEALAATAPAARPWPKEPSTARFCRKALSCSRPCVRRFSRSMGGRENCVLGLNGQKTKSWKPLLIPSTSLAHPCCVTTPTPQASQTHLAVACYFICSPLSLWPLHPGPATCLPP